MGERYLIDSNVIIDFSENKLPAKARNFIASIIDDTPTFSVINKIELLGFSSASDIIIELINTSNIIGLTDDIVTRTIAIRQKHKIKLPDAIIAATAIESNCVLMTRNTSDFQNIKSLKILDPYEK